MPQYDRYDQGIPRPVLSDAPNIETAMRDLVDGVVEHVVLYFDSASERAATMTGLSSPVSGSLTYLRDSKRYEYWDGTVWRRVVPQQQSGTANVTFTSRDEYRLNITFPQAFPTAPRVFVNIGSSVGPAAYWSARADAVTSTGFVLFLYSRTNGENAAWSGVPVMWFATP